MQVEFVTSAADLDGRPERVLPEFAFVGRSNVGKSSLINLFLNRKAMAKTSGKPGKTRLLNYFLVDDRYYLVDLPGYGFAKVDKGTRAHWRRLMQAYLNAEDRPKAVFQLVDIRHKPSAEDLEMRRWLEECGDPWAVVVTKADKVSRTKRPERFREIAQVLELPADTPFFPTSATGREGVGDLHAWVQALLTGAEQEEAER
ncbi:YihA family ribosome biogenesis GTP-binding protein [bacterium]|nr:YihA family ribosome biogenesis GTP-binding protein [bacterium]HPF35557.1 ribosome biogenesis GTP-binding protein YihA/YsxC [Candidatus Krumholzibacteria bacterium]HRX50133.1 ribosome biogenesis GTP-binding protein YihA/YsxC [Candidatus Krumholzibacteria bacterium]